MRAEHDRSTHAERQALCLWSLWADVVQGEMPRLKPIPLALDTKAVFPPESPPHPRPFTAQLRLSLLLLVRENRAPRSHWPWDCAKANLLWRPLVKGTW